VRIDLNDLKMVISISLTLRLAVIEENERWGKCHEKYFINLYYIDFFYCNTKIAKNWQELLHRFNTINNSMINI